MPGSRCSAGAGRRTRSCGSFPVAQISASSVGGTADQFWDGRAARSLPAEVVEIDGADHALLVPGRLAASAALLGLVITAVEDFLDHIVWP